MSHPHFFGVAGCVFRRRILWHEKYVAWFYGTVNNWLNPINSPKFPEIEMSIGADADWVLGTKALTKYGVDNRTYDFIESMS